MTVVTLSFYGILFFNNIIILIISFCEIVETASYTYYNCA